MKHNKVIRALVDEAVPEPIVAMVLLIPIAGSSGAHDGGSDLRVDVEQTYIRKQGLDPALRIESLTAAWGLVCALTDMNVHFLLSGGRMRNDPTVMLASSSARQSVELRHRRAGVPPIAHRTMHFTFDGGHYYVANAVENRLLRNEINDSRRFVERWGPSAIDLRA